jgi:hypothetical protein
MENKAEDMLRELLDVSDLQDPDFRPLHVLIGGIFHETWEHADHTLIEAVTQWGTEFDELMTQAGILGKIRSLDARSAAIIPSVGEAIGSQQVVDRYPQHFDTVGAMEQHRSRARKKLNEPERRKDRFIEFFRTGMGAER